MQKTLLIKYEKPDTGTEAENVEASKEDLKEAETKIEGKLR